MKMSERYRCSEEMLERALKVIPLGAQTFSKSRTHYPAGVSPVFIQRGLGSHVWDVDGHEYVDFINSLAAITLGHNDPDVTIAVKNQLEEGTIFSLSHPIEVMVAEKIVEMVPCAQTVRFGKNGSDATAGAVRLARAFTKRDHIAVCGYHGWQDWYIGSTARNLGVPEVTQSLTHKFVYNDINSLAKIFADYPGQVAGVILEPMNTSFPQHDFLAEVKALTHKHGAVLIFDEMVTGFRFANGGAQELFGVTPDLATFGKGLANGYPVSAVAGRADIMKLMEEIFFSFTFGGETLSLAAAYATLTKLQRLPVLETIKQQGEKLLIGVQQMIAKHDVSSIFSLAGHPSWSFLLMKDLSTDGTLPVKTLFLQEIFKRNILAAGTHVMSYAHTDLDIALLIKAYDEIFPMIKNAIEEKTLDQILICKPLRPLFQVR